MAGAFFVFLCQVGCGMVQPRNFATRNMHHTTMQHATCSMQHTTIPVNCVRLLRQVGRGIIPRALEQILKSSDSGKHKGWTYTLERQTNLYSLPPQQPTDPYPYPFVAPARPTVGESVRPEFAPHRDGAHPRHIGTGRTRTEGSCLEIYNEKARRRRSARVAALCTKSRRICGPVLVLMWTTSDADVHTRRASCGRVSFVGASMQSQM